MSRIGQRAETALNVTIMRGGKQIRAQVQNLSITGANASAPFPPGLNEDVQMICKGKILDCKVVWAKGRTFGLAFKSPLSEAALQDLVGEGKPTASA
ncbi:PilZ domain-containing protein [Sphingobium sp. BS19]|uniref:PilZ domain-containing protein n=1 Tax=Sphingobium sp. BS19 TaxID=3018973 RepID=UPI0024932779|nr:PilZ domain-containing protein [Sphingobium sp. BS19]|tara:strand:+ start:34 stop:324 length:291 start_codon:yes stop_codon:yes gene_type:complete